MWHGKHRYINHSLALQKCSKWDIKLFIATMPANCEAPVLHENGWSLKWSTVQPSFAEAVLSETVSWHALICITCICQIDLWNHAHAWPESVVNIVGRDTTYSPTVKLGSYVENQNANGGEKWSARHVNIQVLPHLLKLWVNGYSHSHGRGPGLRITWWRHNFSR